MLLTKHFKLFLLVLIPYSFGVLPSNAQYRFENDMHCVVDDRFWDDSFWFCGQHSSNSCNGTNVWNNDTLHPYTHKGKTNIQGANYYCCANDGYDSEGKRVIYSGSNNGRFVQGNDWIKETKTITETFPGGGKCTWTQKINICGMVDNPTDKCTSPSNCDVGLSLRNNACVESCDESNNMAFASATSNTCVSCEQTKTQGIVNHICKKCDERTEVFDIEKSKCVSKTDKILAQTTFFDKCWLCYTPEDLHKCLKNVSNGVAVPEQCKMGYNPDALNSK